MCLVRATTGVILEAQGEASHGTSWKICLRRQVSQFGIYVISSQGNEANEFFLMVPEATEFTLYQANGDDLRLKLFSGLPPGVYIAIIQTEPDAS
jgi:hypothetical protein